MTSVGPRARARRESCFHCFSAMIWISLQFNHNDQIFRFLPILFFKRRHCWDCLSPNAKFDLFSLWTCFHYTGILPLAGIDFSLSFFVTLFKDLLNQANAQVIVEHKIDARHPWDSQKCWDNMVLLVVAMAHAWESAFLYAMQYVYLVLHLKIVGNIKCFLSLLQSWVRYFSRSSWCKHDKKIELQANAKNGGRKKIWNKQGRPSSTFAHT